MFVLTEHRLSHLMHVSCDVNVLGFEDLMAINDSISFFWDRIPCGLVGS